MNKNILLAVLPLMIAACASTDSCCNIPSLLDGESKRLHYLCQEGGSLQIEYAFMGGQYSATIIESDSKRVLPQSAANHFTDQQWQWQASEQGFNLSKSAEITNYGCKAYGEVDQRGITLFN